MFYSFFLVVVEDDKLVLAVYSNTVGIQLPDRSCIQMGLVCKVGKCLEFKPCPEYWTELSENQIGIQMITIIIQLILYSD